MTTCKIGEDVYCIEEVHYDKVMSDIMIVHRLFDISMENKLGKTVFLTLDEARKEVDKMLGNCLRIQLK